MIQKTLTLQMPNEVEMHEFGVTLGRLLQRGDVLSLNGPLGAGKTTLTRGIGEGVGASGNISSPTFLIARTHQSKSGIPFVHIDAYRLSHVNELLDLDIDYQNSISVIEWGSGYADGLTDSILEIEIARELETENRSLTLSGTGRFEDISNFIDEQK